MPYHCTMPTASVARLKTSAQTRDTSIYRQPPKPSATGAGSRVPRRAQSRDSGYSQYQKSQSLSRSYHQQHPSTSRRSASMTQRMRYNSKHVMSTSMPQWPTTTLSAANIGSQVIVNGGKRGQLKFIGPIFGKEGIYCGIELYEPTGLNNGSYNGLTYFTAAPSHGLFAPVERVKLAPIKRDTTFDAQHQLDGRLTQSFIDQIEQERAIKIEMETSTEDLFDVEPPSFLNKDSFDDDARSDTTMSPFPSPRPTTDSSPFPSHTQLEQIDPSASSETTTTTAAITRQVSELSADKYPIVMQTMSVNGGTGFEAEAPSHSAPMPAAAPCLNITFDATVESESTAAATTITPPAAAMSSETESLAPLQTPTSEPNPLQIGSSLSPILWESSATTEQSETTIPAQSKCSLDVDGRPLSAASVDTGFNDSGGLIGPLNMSDTNIEHVLLSQIETGGSAQAQDSHTNHDPSIASNVTAIFTSEPAPIVQISEPDPPLNSTFTTDSASASNQQQQLVGDPEHSDTNITSTDQTVAAIADDSNNQTLTTSSTTEPPPAKVNRSVTVTKDSTSTAKTDKDKEDTKVAAATMQAKGKDSKASASSSLLSAKSPAAQAAARPPKVKVISKAQQIANDLKASMEAEKKRPKKEVKSKLAAILAAPSPVKEPKDDKMPSAAVASGSGRMTATKTNTKNSTNTMKPPAAPRAPRPPRQSLLPPKATVAKRSTTPSASAAVSNAQSATNGTGIKLPSRSTSGTMGAATGNGHASASASGDTTASRVPLPRSRTDSLASVGSRGSASGSVASQPRTAATKRTTAAADSKLAMNGTSSRANSNASSQSVSGNNTPSRAGPKQSAAVSSRMMNTNGVQRRPLSQTNDHDAKRADKHSNGVAAVNEAEQTRRLSEQQIRLGECRLREACQAVDVFAVMAQQYGVSELALRGRVADLQQALNAAKGMIEASAQERVQLCETHSRAVELLHSETAHALQTLQSKLDTESAQSLSEQHAQLTAKHAEHVQSIKEECSAQTQQQLDETNALCEDKLNHMQAQCSNTINELKRNQQLQLEELDSQLRLANQRIDDLQTHLQKSADEKYQMLTKEVSSLQDVLNMRLNELRELRSKNAELRLMADQIPDKDVQLRKMKTKLDDMKKQMEHKNEVEKTLTKKCHELSESAHKVQQNQHRLFYENEALKDKLNLKGVMEGSVYGGLGAASVLHSDERPVAASRDSDGSLPGTGHKDKNCGAKGDDLMSRSMLSSYMTGGRTARKLHSDNDAIGVDFVAEGGGGGHSRAAYGHDPVKQRLHFGNAPAAQSGSEEQSSPGSDEGAVHSAEGQGQGEADSAQAQAQGGGSDSDYEQGHLGMAQGSGTQRVAGVADSGIFTSSAHSDLHD